LLAIERFVGFVEENVNCTKRFAIRNDRHWQRKIKDLKEWITPQLGMMRRYADEETRTRNSRTVYESEGKWTDYSFILAVCMRTAFFSFLSSCLILFDFFLQNRERKSL
jgi:hypothetical protein